MQYDELVFHFPHEGFIDMVYLKLQLVGQVILHNKFR